CFSPAQASACGVISSGGGPSTSGGVEHAENVQAEIGRSCRRAGMAKIVLAMATTHGPQLHTTVEQWQLRVKADQSRKHPFRSGVYSFDELVAMRVPEGLDRKSSMEAQHSYHSRCHVAMVKLADKWEEVGAGLAVHLRNAPTRL